MGHKGPRPTDGGKQGGALAADHRVRAAAGSRGAANGREDAPGEEMGRVASCSRQSALASGGSSARTAREALARRAWKRERRARRWRAAARGGQRAFRGAVQLKE